METVKINLYKTYPLGKRLRRVLYARSGGISPYLVDGEILRIEVTTPSVLPKDQCMRTGAELEGIDYAPFRFCGHIEAILNETRPVKYGWDVFRVKDLPL